MLFYLFYVSPANEAYATRTILGWVLNGPLGFPKSVKIKKTMSSHFIDSLEPNLDNQLEKFWKLDGSECLLDGEMAMSLEDTRVIKIWENSFKFKDGHYELPIPFKEPNVTLPNNRCVLNIAKQFED